ncbi:MAG: toll/interleukin-1 receptor domain-containing protein [Nitrospira sp.]
MIVDLDQWIHAENEVGLGDRVFAHDLFISHRRFDLPQELASRLTDYGTQAIWDCDLDLRDRRVMHAVGRAMRRSRYVALFVSNNYADSPWCAAEYQSALSIEHRFNVQRALVVLESERAIERIPEPMANQSQFLASENGISALSAFVQAGNQAADENPQTKTLRRLPREQLAPRVDLLSVEEHLNILEQRLAWWSESEIPAPNSTEQERASYKLMEGIGNPYSEVEDIVRGVRKCVLEKGPTFKGLDNVTKPALRRVVAIANIITSVFAQTRRNDEAQASAEWLYDCLLKPLLLAVASRELHRDTVLAYRATCDALAAGSQSANVPIYLRVLDAIIENGGDIEPIIRKGTLWLIEAR